MNRINTEKNFLPFALPMIGKEEIDEVIDCLQSGWLTTGPKTQQFEEEFANFIGSRHALAVNSATAGLHLSLEASGLQPGDRVITSPYTFTATAEVIRYLGGDPVFVDIDPVTLNLDPEKTADFLQADESSNKPPKAIIPVHFSGLSCEMDSLKNLAEAHQMTIIEDAAHAIPAQYKSKMIGTIGDATVFSFYATKTITTGEGGMITTNNDAWAKRIRMMRLHGIKNDVFSRYNTPASSWYYEVMAPGFKYNMTDIAAAIGIHQLHKAETFRHKRESIAKRYTAAFQNLPLRLPVVPQTCTKHAWHLYVIQLKLDQLKISRNQFIELMTKSGIGTSVHFIPLHLQPYWRDKYGFKAEDFPQANSVYNRIVSLPIYPKMTDEDVERVISTVTAIIEQQHK